jgi:hypothetical protein
MVTLRSCSRQSADTTFVAWPSTSTSTIHHGIYRCAHLSIYLSIYRCINASIIANSCIDHVYVLCMLAFLANTTSTYGSGTNICGFVRKLTVYSHSRLKLKIPWNLFQRPPPPPPPNRPPPPPPTM